MIKRKKTKSVQCGSVVIGGGAPITIQSMTNTDTRDVKSTLEQIRELSEAGVELIRLAIPDEEAACSFGEIKKEMLKNREMKDIPLIADIHFDYRLAILAMKNGADKVRVNPGNIGGSERVKAVIDVAKERNIPIRVGVNSGSLERDILKKYGCVTAQGLCESVLGKIQLLEEMNFDDIVLSIKSSDIMMNLEAHKLISHSTNYPIHIGLTEAGRAEKGMIKSAVGLSPLLLEGIGDTMRISLTGNPINEVILARDILEALEIRKSGIKFVSCPTCGRTRVDLEAIASNIEKSLSKTARRRSKTEMEDLTIAIMGCAVNGPGEAREADLGVACGDGKGVIFSKGKIIQTVEEEHIPKVMIELAEKMSER